jgi:hypothetical protein
LRPIFIYQSAPNKNTLRQGGNIEFFGTQARLAFCESFSIVLNKLGGIWYQPSDQGLLSSGSGFAEVWIGPKWTFLRNENTKTLGALGLTFEMPVGSSNVAQDNGTLSLTPYLSMAQAFGRSSYGSFDVMGTLGYSFSINNTRSEHFFTSLHLDYNIANANKFYPMLELNWFQYTRNGDVTPIGFEGADLFNFGAFGVDLANRTKTSIAGNTFISLAPGFRYKWSECLQFGTAVEFPITGRKDLMDFRLTVDLIWRY